MADRTVAVRLRAEVGSYITGVKQAAAATKDLASSTLDTAQKHKQAFTTAGLAVGAFGAAAAAGVGLAVKHFADFDQEMSNVQAATHAGAAAMTSLRDAALEAGARTVFSANEAADAVEQLAKAGVSTRDILGGGLNGALDLAAAGSLQVGDAAEIAATALTQFGLKGAQIPHVADLLAAAAGKAQGEVSDMGMALKQSGLVAAQTGLTVEETTTALAAFASAGLLGSDAGTSLKTMLQRLTPQSAEAAKAMSDMGISAYDANGNFVGLEKFAGNLQTSLTTLTDEQRNSTLATIFGSDAVRAAAVLYNQGAAGIADWTKKVDDAGYAQETARIKLDNLKGDIEAFSGSLDTAFIKTGSAGNGMARSVVQSATAVVNAYNDLPVPVQHATLGLSAFVAVAATASGGFLVLAPRITETRNAMATLSTELPRTTAAMQGLGKAGAIASLIVGTALAIDALVDALAKAPPGAGALTDGLVDFVKTGKATGDVAELLGSDFSRLGDKIKVASKTKWVDFQMGGPQKIEEARKALEALDQTLTAFASSHPKEAAAAFDAMATAAAADGVSVEELKEKFPGYIDAVAQASAETKLGADAQGGLAGAAGAAGAKIGGEAKSLSDLEKELRDVTGQVLGLRDAQRGYEQSLDDLDASRVKNGKSLDIHTQKGRDNAAALDAVAKSANDVLQEMIDSGRPYDEVNKKLREQREVLVAAAMKFGVTKEQAKQYADSVLKIPPAASTEVKTPGIGPVKIDLKAVKDYLAGINGTVATASVVVNGTGGILTGLSAIDHLMNTLDGKTATVKVIKSDDGTGLLTGPLDPGPVEHKADGGWVSGPGGPRDDMVQAYLSPGEFVTNAADAARNGPVLERMNRGQRFADGGWVSGHGGAGGMTDAQVARIERALQAARPLVVQATGRDLSERDLIDEAVFANRSGRLS